MSSISLVCSLFPVAPDSETSSSTMNSLPLPPSNTMATSSCTFSLKFWLDCVTQMLKGSQQCQAGKANTILLDTLRNAVADELAKTFDLPILPLPSSPTTNYHTAAAVSRKSPPEGQDRSLAHFSWRVAQSLWCKLCQSCLDTS